MFKMMRKERGVPEHFQFQRSRPMDGGTSSTLLQLTNKYNIMQRNKSLSFKSRIGALKFQDNKSDCPGEWVRLSKLTFPIFPVLLSQFSHCNKRFQSRRGSRTWIRWIRRGNHQLEQIRTVSNTCGKSDNTCIDPPSGVTRDMWGEWEKYFRQDQWRWRKNYHFSFSIFFLHIPWYPNFKETFYLHLLRLSISVSIRPTCPVIPRLKQLYFHRETISNFEKSTLILTQSSD